MSSSEEVTLMDSNKKDSMDLPSCRMRKKSIGPHDENDNVSSEPFELVEDLNPDDVEAPGILSSLWAKAPALPSIQPLAYVQEAPGMLASLWRSTPTPSFQNVAHMVHGTFKLQSILQSMIPGSNTSAAEDKIDDEVEEVDKDVTAVETPLKSVKKVENKKQS